MLTDPISDYLTRIRNASMAGHLVLDIPSSKIKKGITKILFDQGFILSYKFEKTADNQGNIKIALKYDKITNWVSPIGSSIEPRTKDARRFGYCAVRGLSPAAR